MKASHGQLSKPSLFQFRWLLYALVDWFVIISAFAAAVKSQNIFVFWVASLFIGNRQHALAFLGHDGSHRAVSKVRVFNDLMTCVFAFWPIGVGLKGYRLFHFRHHRYVGTSSDPELIHKALAAPEFSLPMTRQKIRLYLIRDLLGFGLRDVIRLARLAPPANVADIAGPLIFTSIFWYFSIQTGHYEMIPLWYFSQASSFWATFRLRVWLEHMGTTGTVRVKLAKWQQFIFAPHGAAFHYEHHRWPSIPCWNLEKARGLDKTEPVIELQDLYKSFEHHAPIPSGCLPANKKSPHQVA